MPTPRNRPAAEAASGDRFFDWVVAPLLAALIWLLSASQRLDLRNRAAFESAARGQRPVVWAGWHEDLVGMSVVRLRLRPPRPVVVMVSRSRDGARLAAVIRLLGAQTVRASSSRGAVRGFIALRRFLGDASLGRRSAVMALDGPRGPRRQAKPGAATLALQSGALIVPMGFHHSRQWVFRSWDRTRLPKPFSRCRIDFGEIIDAAAWEGDVESLSEELARRLNALGDPPGPAG